MGHIYPVMKTHIIEIDAQAAFKNIGVDLKINPFAEQCTAALKERINQCITPQLLVYALAEAAGSKRKLRRRNSNKSSTPSEPQTGGPANER